MIKLNNILKELTCGLEDNEIEMDIVCWGGRGNKKNVENHLQVIYDMIGSYRI